MKKIPFLSYAYFAIAVLLSSCMKLNGKYCTSNVLTNFSKIFDRKNKVFTSKT